MKSFLQKIFRPRIGYKPLIEVKVFKDAILHNLSEYQKTYPRIKFAPVLKSNAYGHGLVQVASILDEYNQLTPSLALPQRGREYNMPFFMVDSFFEALQLKREGIKTKILILGYSRLPQIVNNKLKNVSFGVIDLEQLKQIIGALKKPQMFHLKIDTGMHRQGVLIDDVDEAIGLIKSNSNFILEGLCSHLATADDGDQIFANQQIEIWNKVADKFKKEFPANNYHSEAATSAKVLAAEESVHYSQSHNRSLHSPSDALGLGRDGDLYTSIKYFHVSNTAGAYFSESIDQNVGRLGIGLYGFNQSPFKKLNLLPALELVSIITSIKTIPEGEKVGYNITYTTSNPTKIATIPVGYYEGVDRRLSNKGFVKIGEKFCPIIGRVSMNMCSIDVSEVEDLQIGDEALIISKNPSDKNSIDNIVLLSGSTQHEFRVHIPQHLKRTVI